MRIAEANGARWIMVAALVTGVLHCTVGAAIRGQTQMIRGVQIAPRSGATEIEVHLRAPARYRSHTPAYQGEVLRIQLDALETEESDGAYGFPRQVLPWSGPASVPLVDLIYEPSTAGTPVLMVRFEHPIRFGVVQRDDPYRISILIDATRREVVSQTPRKPDTAPEHRPPGPPGAPAPEGPTAPASRVEDLMQSAREAMTRRDHETAVRVLTKILTFPEHAHSEEAKELLGLARQRKGQLAHAKAEYEDYLARYPDSEGAVRVRQRLDALLTAGRRPERRPVSVGRETGLFSFESSGSVSQAYRTDLRKTDLEGTETTDEAIFSDLFWTGRARGERLSFRTKFAGSHRYDLEEGRDGDETRINHLLFEATDRPLGLSLRAGRQSGTRAGVLGRFDGLLLGYRVRPAWKLNLVSGFPVEFSDSNSINRERPFFGASVDIGPVAEHLDLQIFGIHQRIDGIEDRSAVGTEFRLTHSTGHLFGLVDYDVSYGSLNTALLVGSWRPRNSTTISFLLDQRSSPILTTSNALQGQSVDRMDALLDLYTEDEARELAEDRSATSRTATVGAMHEITPRLMAGLEFTATHLSSTPASGGVEGGPGTGTEYAYAAHLTRTDWLLDGDYLALSLRYLDGDVADRTSLDLTGRYPITRQLRIAPRLRGELRNRDEGNDEFRFRPSLRIDYRWRRRFILEAEVGAEWIRDRDGDDDQEESRYFTTVGYRCDF